MIYITKMLKDRRDELMEMKRNVDERLSKLKYKGKPEYHVRFDNSKNQLFVNKAKDRSSTKYITEEKTESAKQIATFDYLTKVEKLIDREVAAIDKALAIYVGISPEDYYGTLCKGRQDLIIPVRLTDEQFRDEWESQPYIPKGFDEDDESEFYTSKNERVRSKSEILIGDALARNNIPYKYECPLYLKGIGTIHPDYTTLNVMRRKVYYWEHLGRMDDEDYAKKNIKRINAYQKNGIMIGDQLILTMETSATPLDVRLIDQIIKHYLLDGSTDN